MNILRPTTSLDRQHLVVDEYIFLLKIHHELVWVLNGYWVCSCWSLRWNTRLRHDQAPTQPRVQLHSHLPRYTFIDLGFLDIMRQFGNVLGLIINLFITFAEPKKAFFILTTIKCALLLLIPLMKVTGMNEVLLSVLMVGIGFLKLQQFIPFYIVGIFVLMKGELWTLWRIEWPWPFGQVS